MLRRKLVTEQDGLRRRDTKLGAVIAMMRDDVCVTDRFMMFNTDLAEALELDNMLAQADIRCRGSIRTEASGSTIGRCI